MRAKDRWVNLGSVSLDPAPPLGRLPREEDEEEEERGRAEKEEEEEEGEEKEEEEEEEEARRDLRGI